MDSETTREIWERLEANLKRLENACQVETLVFRDTQAAVCMLLECDPAEVLACVEGSSLPTRALVSWLAYEGGRMGMAEKVGALVQQWGLESDHTENLISPPPLESGIA
ncbi:hypothetical protein AAU61_09620 [Desulfocarbo indianensis]|nr:hypothetical protein AAU61_09620 [Desulfocarbo indianensis]